jgi:hypothetical protein
MKLIYLSEVKRRFLSQDNYDKEKPPHYFMPGKIFAIPYEKIENLHLTYYSVETPLDELKQPTSQENSGNSLKGEEE